MAKRGGGWAQKMAELRERLYALMSEGKADQGRIAEVLRLADELNRIFTETAGRGGERHDGQGFAQVRRPRSPQAVTRYRVENGPKGLCLSEYRAAGRQPFRCPAEEYRATAKVVSALKEPMQFEDLYDRVEASLGYRPADYTVRVCLRFWERKGIVRHERTRFAPVSGSRKFEGDANRAWDDAERAPFEPSGARARQGTKLGR